MSRNQHQVAQHGRDPGLRLQRGDAQIGLTDWGREVLRDCAPIAAALDAAASAGGSARPASTGTAEVTRHRDALAAAATLLDDPGQTPSAHTLRAMAQGFDNSFSRFALEQSRQHHRTLLALPFGADAQVRFARMAEESLAEQRRIEAADDMPFETYRQRYLAGELPLPDAG